MSSEIRTRNLSDIAFGDPRVPVIDKGVVGRVVILILAEGPFIDDTIVARVLE